MENKPMLHKYAAECVEKDLKHIKEALTKDPGATALHITFLQKPKKLSSQKEKLRFFLFLSFVPPNWNLADAPEGWQLG
jgi:hypothetical protein